MKGQVWRTEWRTDLSRAATADQHPGLLWTQEIWPCAPGGRLKTVLHTGPLKKKKKRTFGAGKRLKRRPAGTEAATACRIVAKGTRVKCDLIGEQQAVFF